MSRVGGALIVLAVACLVAGMVLSMVGLLLLGTGAALLSIPFSHRAHRLENARVAPYHQPYPLRAWAEDHPLDSHPREVSSLRRALMDGDFYAWEFEERLDAVLASPSRGSQPARPFEEVSGVIRARKARGDMLTPAQRRANGASRASAAYRKAYVEAYSRHGIGHLQMTGRHLGPSNSAVPRQVIETAAMSAEEYEALTESLNALYAKQTALSKRIAEGGG